MRGLGVLGGTILASVWTAVQATEYEPSMWEALLLVAVPAGLEGGFSLLGTWLEGRATVEAARIESRGTVKAAFVEHHGQAMFPEVME